jgi:ribosome hibernation promoting factor
MKNLSIKGLHMELTDALESYVQDKMSSLKKFLPHDAHVMVEIGRPSIHHKTGTDIYQAEIEASTAKQTFFISITDADLYAAIDRARDEIVELIKQGKSKKTTMVRRGGMMMKDLMKIDFMGPVKGLPKRLRKKFSKTQEE